MDNEQKDEYSLFKVKVIKLGKDFNDELSKLSPENLDLFKKEMLEVLPISLINLINNLKN